MTTPQRSSAKETSLKLKNSIAAIYPGPGVRIHNNPRFAPHAVYIYKGMLFDANDYIGWKPGLPPDGFHLKPWTKYSRPLMNYRYSLHHGGLTKEGECALFANSISKVVRNIGINSFLTFMDENGNYPDVGERLLELSKNLPRGKI